MSTLTKGLTATFLAALIGLGSIVPTSAQNFTRKYDQRDQVIQSYCDRNRGDRDCRGFRPGRWHDRDYDNFYRGRRDNLDGIASGIFGFTFGAIVGSALANQNQGRDRVIGYEGGGYSGHVQACYNRYRSYDERSDTFMGYDGRRHRCDL